ncbi:hypothetical protein E2C01_014812 [Portunus trituberculatus]|uniref:Uncharacterized protein n=1 Tax=Portunus trituberculatus TaxID=210409 RepID=A0A5B7DKZ7_PORTR|nr:hypothetical protein [Portunus trituberculatus]
MSDCDVQKCPLSCAARELGFKRSTHIDGSLTGKHSSLYSLTPVPPVPCFLWLPLRVTGCRDAMAPCC